MILKGVPVTVFGSILGTGGVILASKTFVPFIVIPLTFVLAALFTLFTVILLAKIVRYPQVVRDELKHPLPGNFFALQPISAVIISILGTNVFPSSIDTGLLLYGAALIMALSVYLPYNFFSNMNVSLSQIHGGWFITPVATILVTNAILIYPASEVNLFVSLLFFGIGSSLFLLLLTVLFFRLLSHDLPPAELAPTNYIMLAPIGILIVDILQLSSYAGNLLGTDMTTLAIVLGVSLWGFGLWAATVNLLMIGKYVRKGLRFHVGWWSYVFPTAAFTLATVALSHYFSFLEPISKLLYIVLIVIFMFILVRSLYGLIGTSKSNESKVPAELSIK